MAVAGENPSARKQDRLGRARGSLNPGLWAPPWVQGCARPVCFGSLLLDNSCAALPSQRKKEERSQLSKPQIVKV